MISFALESPWFESYTDTLSLAFVNVFFFVVVVVVVVVFYYYCETTDTADENLDL